MSRRVILLVEDNEEEVVLTMRAIRKNNIASDVVVARDGRAALDYVFGRAAEIGDQARSLPWIILLDLKMPGLGGLETLACLRTDERTKLVPVMVLSASNRDEDVRQSYALGANSYLRKPIDFTEFAGLMEMLHRYWLANETPLSERESLGRRRSARMQPD